MCKPPKTLKHLSVIPLPQHHEVLTRVIESWAAGLKDRAMLESDLSAVVGECTEVAELLALPAYHLGTRQRDKPIASLTVSLHGPA